nr:reverse transcriptase domain-containing protein [Tanacetum cinerariifolium]
MPRNVNLINAKNLVARTCFECGSTDHTRSACLRLNQAQRPVGNQQNQVVVVNGGLGRRNHRNQARGRAFMMGAKEAYYDSNIVTGMDWLSDHKAEIICHEKMVKIPLLDGKVLRVLGEKLEEKIRQLMSAKAKEKEQEKIVVVRDFPKVFLNDLSRLPPVQEIKFWIALIHRATPVAKSPYRLAPSKLEKLSRQLKELQNKGFIRPSLGEHRPHLGLVMDISSSQMPFGLTNAPVRRWIELFSDYDCEIRYHPGKENVVADALSRKERVKPKRKWEGIAMDFVTKLPRTSSGHDTIWVIMDRLTKSTYFLPMRKDYKMGRLARLYLNEIISRLGVPISIISDHDSQFTSKFWHSMQEALGTWLDMSTAYHPQTDGQSERMIQTLEDMLRAYILDIRRSWDVHLPLVEFSYNNSYHSSVRCALFEALYGMKCRSPIMWAGIEEGHLIGPELVQETTEKI